MYATHTSLSLKQSTTKTVNTRETHTLTHMTHDILTRELSQGRNSRMAIKKFAIQITMILVYFHMYLNNITYRVP
jgi:hypothetical protein